MTRIEGRKHKGRERGGEGRRRSAEGERGRGERERGREGEGGGGGKTERGREREREREGEREAPWRTSPHPPADCPHSSPGGQRIVVGPGVFEILLAALGIPCHSHFPKKGESVEGARECERRESYL